MKINPLKILCARPAVYTLLLLLVVLLSVGTVSAAMILNEDFSDPSKLTYFAFEGDGFKAVNGTFTSANATKYNACYFGQYYEECVFEFDFRDNGDGTHIGGGSLRVGSARYDVEIVSDAAGIDEKIKIWKGGPNKKASNTMKSTGKGIPAIPLNTWVNVKIALTKSNIKVYVGDVLYVDYTDVLPYTNGGFGLRSQNSDLSYDNMKIYDLADLVLSPKPTTKPTPTSGPTKAVTPDMTPATTPEATPTTEIAPSATGSPSTTAEATPTTATTLTDAPTPTQGATGGLPTAAVIGIIAGILVIAGGGVWLLKRRK